MLVLSRKLDESFIIGNSVSVKVIDISGSSVKLGIEAPKSITIYRKEIYDVIVQENSSSSDKKELDLDKLLSAIKKKPTK